MSDRATVIGNIAASLRRGAAPRTTARAGPAAAAGEPEAASWPQDLLVERFSAELTAIAGRVHRAGTPREAIDAMLEVCREHGASRVLSWAPEWIGVPGPARGADCRRHRHDGGWLPHGPERPGRLAALDPICVGVTGAIAGIAESGTIAVVSGPGRPRLASLLAARAHRGAAGGSPVPVTLGVPRGACRTLPSGAATLS